MQHGSPATTLICRSIGWLPGRTLGGLQLYPDANRLDRGEALRLYTVGSSWFSSEESQKGTLVPGQFADLAVLTADYFSIPEEEIKCLESVLTIVGGKIVYASAEFSKLDPPALSISPDWSPVKHYGGYTQTSTPAVEAPGRVAFSEIDRKAPREGHRQVLGENGTWELGCDCFAF
jgi:hypothetical protein